MSAVAKKHMPADMSSLFEVAGRMGEISGAQQAIVSEMSRLNGELVRLGAELDRKHTDNMRAIAERHEENRKILDEHKNQDALNFAKIFKWFNYMSGAIGVLVVLWGVFQVALPIILKARLGE
jgi:hypothetical protein